MKQEKTTKNIKFEDIKKILKGIDQNQITSDEGWWETSTGVNFGKNKLEEIKKLFNRSLH